MGPRKFGLVLIGYLIASLSSVPHWADIWIIIENATAAPDSDTTINIIKKFDREV